MQSERPAMQVRHGLQVVCRVTVLAKRGHTQPAGTAGSAARVAWSICVRGVVHVVLTVAGDEAVGTGDHVEHC